jgi:hypothetical protein
VGETLCPRCEARRFTPYGEGPASDEAPYPALSRVADIYICNWCGVNEAFIDLAGAPPIPPDEWPVVLPEETSVL